MARRPVPIGPLLGLAGLGLVLQASPLGAAPPHRILTTAGPGEPEVRAIHQRLLVLLGEEVPRQPADRIEVGDPARLAGCLEEVSDASAAACLASFLLQGGHDRYLSARAEAVRPGAIRIRFLAWEAEGDTVRRATVLLVAGEDGVAMALRQVVRAFVTPGGPMEGGGRGGLLVRVAGSARVRVDGEEAGVAPAAVFLAAGRHRVEVEAPSYRTWRSEIEVEEGVFREVVPALEPGMEGLPPASRRTLALGAASGVLAVGGAVFGLLARRAQADFDATPLDAAHIGEAIAQRSRGEDASLTANACFGAAAAALLTAGVSYALDWLDGTRRVEALKAAARSDRNQDGRGGGP